MGLVGVTRVHNSGGKSVSGEDILKEEYVIMLAPQGLTVQRQYLLTLCVEKLFGGSIEYRPYYRFSFVPINWILDLIDLNRNHDGDGVVPDNESITLGIAKLFANIACFIIHNSR